MITCWMASHTISLADVEPKEPRELSFRLLEFMFEHHGEWPEWVKIALKGR